MATLLYWYVMITLLTGSNSFEIAREVARRETVFGSKAEKVEGKELTLGELPQLLSGATLFADKRLIVISELSENSTLWTVLPDWIGRVSDDVELLLIESAPDKRTKAYKTLQVAAEVRDFQLLTERDSAKAEQWVLQEAKRLGMSVDKAATRTLLKRSLVPTDRGQPVIDQWQIMHSLEKLSVFEKVTSDTVEQYIDTQPIDSVFGVFETALKGDTKALHTLLADLEPREDPYKVFGLLSSQVFQLAAIATSEDTPSDTAKSIGMHPFAAGKMAPLAERLNKHELRQIVLALTAADEAMKTSKGTPWTLIEQALMKIAATANGK